MNLPSWKRLVIALPLLVLWGCSQETNTEKGAPAPEAAQVSDAESEGTVTPTSYTEYLQCQFGQNYSPEAFQPFLADWNQRFLSCLIEGCALSVICQEIGHRMRLTESGCYVGLVSKIGMRAGKIMPVQGFKTG